jgi:hypothetical protein
VNSSEPSSGTEDEEAVVAWLRLSEPGRPIDIWTRDSLEPIRPHSAVITRNTLHLMDRLGPITSFNLSLRSSDGEELAYFQFETMDIALDQASEILGVARDQWEMAEGGDR